ncbi:hypothetical protein DNTS_003586 [Danionella cerebrum]|uniref:Stathmin domain-containing protein 1 n=1 Tax=Danionella cerebrum TaxID=2873325 RepID=A0A553RHR1_9TELE|nr:hypothetical protein DNTS_003586 [Danionella translucida]
MGCGSSKITVVQPVKPSSLDGNERETLEGVMVQGGARGDSAVSKMTSDSGVSLDTAGLPGSVPRLLPPIAVQSPGLVHQSEPRVDSNEILGQLLDQGIIPAQTKHGGSGQAYHITMMDDSGKPRSRPPARLESLKIKKEQENLKKEDIDIKMRQVEERRKEREEDLKRRLRVKSARPRLPVTEGDELLHSEQLPVQTRTTLINGASEEQRLADSPELENDSSFQVIGDEDEDF